MESTKPQLKHYATIALIVVISILLLFSIDKDTHRISDLFKPLNIAALVLYFIPTFSICALLFKYFSKKRTYSSSKVLCLILGIPTSFALVIIAFLLLKS